MSIWESVLLLGEEDTKIMASKGKNGRGKKGIGKRKAERAKKKIKKRRRRDPKKSEK